MPTLVHRVTALLVILGTLVVARATSAQSLPPVDGKTNTVAPGTTGLVSKPWLLPLFQPDKRKAAGQTVEQFIQEYYGRPDNLNPADQVEFVYGFGGNDRKSLAADLITAIMPGGVRIAAGSSVATDATSSATTQTPQEALQRLRDGGDLYITAAYPIVSLPRGKDKYVSGYIFFYPRFNFLFNGFGGTSTVTEVNEFSMNWGVSGYFEWRSYGDTIVVFTQGRWGLQTLSQQLQASTQVTSSTFGVGEIEVGMLLSSSLRISGRYLQPPPGPASVQDPLKGFHIGIQFAPLALKK